MGPYEFDTMFDNGTIKLITIDDAHTPLLANGHRLRLFHCPTSRDFLIRQFFDDSSFEVICVENYSSAPLIE